MAYRFLYTPSFSHLPFIFSLDSFPLADEQTKLLEWWYEILRLR
ncbi:hypothetical protein [Virgibacillus pantothenticus]|nr:hypothetical protein [Virgibacillus pantothenticus]